MPDSNPKIPVNSQITDAVTQTNVNVVASSPAEALGVLYQMATHSAGLSMQNSVSSQQNLNQIANAVVATAVREILAISPSGTTESSTKPTSTSGTE